MNLTRLRYFAIVAEELHFGRAAARLHMAQPPLSQQIRRLEQELDVALFDRTTRRVTLTDAGRLLQGEAVRLLAAAAGVERLMQQHRRGEGGVLRLGFVDSAAYGVMPRVLREYRRRWPDVQFELHSMSSDEQFGALRDGRIDVGIGRNAVDPDQIDATTFLQETLLVAADATHPLGRVQTTKLSRLAGERMVGFDRSVSPSLHAELVLMFAAERVTYDPLIEATEYATVLGLVAAGEGVAVVPASVTNFGAPDLCYARLRDRTASLPLMLLMRRGERLPLVTQTRALVGDLYGLADGDRGGGAQDTDSIDR